jgi:hypothetical protein
MDHKLSFWMKARDIANLVALVSIGSYSLYSLWKRYIAPRLFGTPSPHDKNYQTLLRSLNQLNESLAELKGLIRELQPVSRPRDPLTELQDLRLELSSIKGLLLSRNQFPSSPGIPSWQMVETEEAEGDSSRRRKERKGSQQRKSEAGLLEEGVDVGAEGGGSSVPLQVRKSIDLDSNNGFNSGSSCEVVFMGGKNDSNSDPDHSDE